MLPTGSGGLPWEHSYLLSHHRIYIEIEGVQKGREEEHVCLVKNAYF